MMIPCFDTQTLIIESGVKPKSVVNNLKLKDTNRNENKLIFTHSVTHSVFSILLLIDDGFINDLS